VDTIHYPSETLQSRVGDCDDTSVLVASLLENVGVSTKLVDAPGHVFIAFDSGLHERHRAALGVSDELTIVDGGRVWIPLETTTLGKSFAGFGPAWRLGAENYNNWKSRGEVALVDIDSAQARYTPGEPPATGRAVAVDTLRLRTALARDGASLSAWKEDHLRTRFGSVRENLAIAPQAVSEVAYAYLLAGKLDEARTKLEQALALDPRSARTRNNLAVVLAAQGRAREACDQFERAQRSDAPEPAIWLNLGFARYAAGDAAGGRAAIKDGLARSGGYAQACTLFGVAAQAPAGGRASGETESAATVRALLTAAEKGGDAGANPLAGKPIPFLHWIE